MVCGRADDPPGLPDRRRAVLADPAAIGSDRACNVADRPRDPESLDVVRQNAPYAFRTQERAVTQQDYGDMAQRCERFFRARSPSSSGAAGFGSAEWIGRIK